MKNKDSFLYRNMAVFGRSNGLLGWVTCFEKAELCGLVAGCIGDSGDAKHHAEALRRVYELGKAL